MSKGLSSNDFTDVARAKLEGIESEANKTVIDNELNLTSLNPVENSAIAAGFTNLYTRFEEVLTPTVALSIPANNFVENDITLTKEGFYPLFVSGWSSFGTGSTKPILTRQYFTARNIGSGTLHYLLVNLTDTTITPTYNFRVMWIRATLN